MTEMNNLLNIISAVDENYVQHYAVMLCSLFENKHNNTEINVFLIDIKISETSKKNIILLSKRYNFKLTFLYVDEKNFYNLKVNGHITLSTYYRIMIPDILPKDIEKIIYIDCDMIILNDISKLWNIDISKYIIGAINDPFIDDKRKKILQIPKDHPYFNGGLLLINVAEWKKQNISKKVINYLLNNPEKILYWDQDGLNAILSDKCLFLPDEYNVATILLANKIATTKNKPAIIHYIGPIKPWHLKPTSRFCNYYYDYLRLTPWSGFKTKNRLFKNLVLKTKYNAYKIISLIHKSIITILYHE